MSGMANHGLEISFPYLRLHEHVVSKVLLAGLPNGEWHKLNLFRKMKGRRQVAVAAHEFNLNLTPDQERISVQLVEAEALVRFTVDGAGRLDARTR